MASWTSAGSSYADAGDPARGRDQIAQDRLALHDPRVLRDMDCGRRLVREAREVGPATDGVKLVTPLERLGDGHDVDRLAPLVEVEDRGIDAAVGLPVEIGGPEELRDLDDCIAIDEERPQDRLLGFEALWRQSVDHDLDMLPWRTATDGVGGSSD